MSEIILLPLASDSLKLEDLNFEEVPMSVFELRDKVVNADGKPRYGVGHAIKKNGRITIDLPSCSDRDIQVITRAFNITNDGGRHGKIRDIDGIIRVKRSPRAKAKAFDVANGTFL